MTDENLTQPVDAESANAPVETEMPGLSDESLSMLGIETSDNQDSQPVGNDPVQLPDEFKPYSQFPWQEIPEEARSDFLEKLKKFHGDMSRGQNELSETKKQLQDFQQKAAWFDELTSQPWFRDAYANRNAAPQTRQQEPVSLDKLNEYGIDSEASKLLDKVFEQKLSRVIGPLSQQLANIQQHIVNTQTGSDLDALRKMATDQGWPAPDAKLSRMSELIQSGRAANVPDAYWLAVREEVPTVVATRTRQQLQDELKRKAAVTFPPPRGNTGAPVEDFTGKDAVEKAFAAAKAELAGLTQQRK